MSTRCDLMSKRPSSKTANRPTGPAPMMRTSVLIVSLIATSFPARAGPYQAMVDCWSRRAARYAIIGNRHGAQQFRRGGLGCLTRGGNGDFRLGRERRAAVEDGVEVLHGARTVLHRSHVPLLYPPRHVLGRLR